MADDENTEAQGASAVVPFKTAAGLVKILCMIFSNINLYSWNHPATKSQIESGWTFLEDILDKHGDLLLTITGGKILFQTEAIEEKNPGVRRLSRHFEDLSISSMSFVTGMVCDEFEAFFRVFSTEAADIEAAGGIAAVFEQEGIANIKMNSSVYRLIHEGEIVVDANNAPQGGGGGGGGGDGGEPPEEEAVIRAFIDDVLKKSQNREDMLSRMQSDPDRVAGQVAKLLEFSDSSVDEESLEKDLKGLHEQPVACQDGKPLSIYFMG